MTPLHLTRKLSFFERITNASYFELFALWLGINVGFAVVYALLATYAPVHAPVGLAHLEPLPRFLDSLYFSIITATSTGYGDIAPQGFSKLLAGIQCISALIVFAVFVTKLVSRQQDAATQDIHRLAFEGIFNDIRLGLVIVRNDMDRVIGVAEKNRTLGEHDWENLTSAYLQAQSFTEDIPNFYQGESDLYTFDRRREEILIDAMRRLLARIQYLLGILESNGIDWKKHRESADRLVDFVHSIDDVIHVWEKFSPHHTIDHFKDVLELQESLHKATDPGHGAAHRHKFGKK